MLPSLAYTFHSHPNFPTFWEIFQNATFFPNLRNITKVQCMQIVQTTMIESVEKDPNRYLSQAYLLEQKGEFSQALELFRLLCAAYAKKGSVDQENVESYIKMLVKQADMLWQLQKKGTASEIYGEAYFLCLEFLSKEHQLTKYIEKVAKQVGAEYIYILI